MEIISFSPQMTATSRDVQREGKRVGFVPTMGALHEGHLSLVRAARAQCEVVVVSIFVNPTQFGPNEDLAKYPRTFDQDKAMLEREGVDCIFYPSVEEMYPPGATTWVTVEGLSEKLDGRSRPGHFRGVTTVVSKLFNIVQPQAAFFGQKDAAQVAIIRKMVRDLNFSVQIVVCPIVRESDGLAMSSRNAYLNPQERKQALVLSRSLRHVQSLIERGERSADKLIAAGRQAIAEEPGVRPDYFEVVDPDTLDPVKEVANGALVAVAGYVGKTRLIDNLLLPAM
ncbi:MAG TPA: pantoate--beta-alanine ligase [Candidatus Acidoferrales bacterium]|jgi:pantoate--beta-alanine ligase|nr:pantoate--beta-alanine ligase [Candidatus Acidoferrales bacterium]